MVFEGHGRECRGGLGRRDNRGWVGRAKAGNECGTFSVSPLNITSRSTRQKIFSYLLISDLRNIKHINLGNGGSPGTLRKEVHTLQIQALLLQVSLGSIGTK